eukprot:TRINITY_DN4347_c0_g1_i2.p1 TRINITY_DN4347_c0_g1~~TRINITY_DN4347_c0_g1_i2.p1  ORF type:complete len:133 (+),score=26.75 TRINITY_DN4347_c0_g1_i2:153-551(+)
MDLSYRRTDISCAICGDKSHPTVDCPLRGGAVGGPVNASKSRLEQEYETFLLILGETYGTAQAQQPQAPAAPSAADAYAAFQAELSGIGGSNAGSTGNNAGPWGQQQWGQPSQYGGEAQYGAVPPPPPGAYF